MNYFLSQLISKTDTLRTAWYEVRAELPAAQVIQEAVSEYERHLMQRLQTLADNIPKGAHRTVSLHTPFTPAHLLTYLDDAVLQRAASQVLAAALKNKPAHVVRDVSAALRQWQRHQAQGYKFVLFAQLADYPHQLDAKLLLQRLNAQLSDQVLLKLLEQWHHAGLLFAEPPLLQIEPTNTAGSWKAWLTQCWQSAHMPWFSGSDQEIAAQVFEVMVATDTNDAARQQLRRAALHRLLGVAALSVMALALLFVSVRLRRHSWPKALLAFGSAMGLLGTWLKKSPADDEKVTHLALAPQTQTRLEQVLAEISLRDFEMTLALHQQPLVRMNEQLAFPFTDKAQTQSTLTLVETLAAERGWRLAQGSFFLVSSTNVEAFFQQYW